LDDVFTNLTIISKKLIKDNILDHKLIYAELRADCRRAQRLPGGHDHYTQANLKRANFKQELQTEILSDL
jgi:hypothetical protein